MVVRDGLIARQANLVAGSQPRRERVSDHTLPVDQLNHNVLQLRKRKRDQQEFHGRKNLKKERNNGIRKKENYQKSI